jgi:hypothetical protein
MTMEFKRLGKKRKVISPICIVATGYNTVVPIKEVKDFNASVINSVSHSETILSSS